MAQANRVHSTPRRTASKIQSKKRFRKVDLTAAAAELTADVPKYTDVAPLIQFNEVKLSIPA